MNIGNKIRSLRVEKLMTQSELAGNEITRNMLSQIENGIALPSLTTVIYLANRLGVSAGFLLADEKDDFMYKKLNTMKNIKKACVCTSLSRPTMKLNLYFHTAV